MASLSDYAELTKFDKSKFNCLKKTIFDVSRKLGSGVLSPVPYDTAFVARIPEINKSKPAFPESLQWLRDHQTEDGSWGSEYPLSIHSKILNTFAAVLAFSQWNYKSDEERIKRGITAVKLLAQSLPREETHENGFELIISSLLDDAREFNLDLPYEQFEWFSKTGKEKLKTIDREIMSNKPNKYWSFLEAAGSMALELASYRSEIAQYGLIAAQPSATAFILRYARLRGENFPEAEWVLKNLCAQNQGGIPHLIPVDNFEIIHGLDYFFKVGINPRLNVKHAVIQKPIDTLIGRLGSTSAMGFSSNWPVADDGCTETALGNVRHFICEDRQGKNQNTIQKNGLYQNFQAFDFSNFFRNSSSLQDSHSKRHLDGTFSKEHSHPSKALQLANKTVMQGIQNLSPYYNLLQYVFSTSKHTTEKLSNIEIFLGESQNSDGGWGDKNPSSVEETAYVALIIFFLTQTKNGVLARVNFHKLAKFMKNIETLPYSESFWCYKVSFRSDVLTEAIITAAKYAVFQIQRLCMFTDEFNYNQLDNLDVEFFDEKEQFVNRGFFPLTRPEVQRQDIEVSRTEIEDIIKRTYQTEKVDAYLTVEIESCLHFSYFTNDFKLLPFDRAIDTMIMMMIAIFDDLFDLYLDGKNPTTVVDEAMNVASKILRGEYTSLDTLPAFNLPRLQYIWRWLFYFREVSLKNKWSIESFTKILEECVFKNYILYYKMQCLDIELTPKMYLGISKKSAGLEELVHFSAMLQDNTIDSLEFENDELYQKFKDAALKAARIASDVPSVFRDLSLSHSDNYCILLMREYGISVAEAMARATWKVGKETMKMYSLKRMILARENEGKEKLVILMRNLERFVHACLRWSLDTPRYRIGQKCIEKRVDYERKPMTFIWENCFNQSPNSEKRI